MPRTRAADAPPVVYRSARIDVRTTPHSTTGVTRSFGQEETSGPGCSRTIRGKALSTLKDKAEVAGIAVPLVDERGASSTCPRCRCKVPKPKGRNFTCPHCDLQAHRDVVGAANIAAKRGGTNVDLSELTVVHRRAGRNLPGHARRRVAMQLHRRGVGPGPAVVRSLDLVVDQPGESLVLAVS